MTPERSWAARLRGPAVALVAAAAGFAFVQWWDFRVPALAGAPYQAVFLASGQTYFGHYFDRIGPYARVDDVYYIQPQPTDDPDKPPESKIVRRGGELHAPLRRVLLAKSAILFVEDLRPSSPVAQFMAGDRGSR